MNSSLASSGALSNPGIAECDGRRGNHAGELDIAKSELARPYAALAAREAPRHSMVNRG